MKKISEEKSYLLTYLPLATFLRIPQSRLPLPEIAANFCTYGSPLKAGARCAKPADCRVKIRIRNTKDVIVRDIVYGHFCCPTLQLPLLVNVGHFNVKLISDTSNRWSSCWSKK